MELKNKYGVPQKNDILMYHMILELSKSKNVKTNEKSIRGFFTNAKKIIKQEGDKCPVDDDRLLSLKNLFNTDSSLINLTWNLIFTLPENGIQSLSKIVNPVESQIILSKNVPISKSK